MMVFDQLFQTIFSVQIKLEDMKMLPLKHCDGFFSAMIACIQKLSITCMNLDDEGAIIFAYFSKKKKEDRKKEKENVFCVFK